MDYIPYGRQCIDEEDIKAVVQVLKSDYLTTGPAVSDFEKAVANYCGAKYAVSVSNGTAALHAACYAIGVVKGDEVIVPAITFAASANAVLYCGGTPEFADIDPINWTIDIKSLESKITDKTKAIIPVHMAGRTCDLDAIHSIANKHGLRVIEDGAHALGAIYKGKKIGNVSELTTFSFHPVKHIATGEGGMVLTNDKSYYESLVMFRSHGITRDSNKLINNDGDWYYEQLFLGYNYRMTDIQAALGLKQMEKLDLFLKRRREIARKYSEVFKDIKEITCPNMDDAENCAWHLYVILVDNRKEVFDRLREANIGVNVHYLPVYKHPYYQNIGYQNICLQNSESYYKKAISLPIFYSLTDEQQDYVIKQVLRACSN